MNDDARPADEKGASRPDTDLRAPDLASIGSRAAPDAWLAVWARYSTWKAEARLAVMHLVAASLRDPAAVGAGDDRVLMLCHTHSLVAQEVEGAVAMFRSLFEQAAARNVGRDAVRADAEAMDRIVRKANPTVAELAANADDVAAIFQDLVPVLRSILAERAILDHGAALQQVHWRIERVFATSRGQGLTPALVHLTLHLREGVGEARNDRNVTVCLPPQGVSELRKVLEGLEATLGAGAGAAQGDRDAGPAAR